MKVKATIIKPAGAIYKDPVPIDPTRFGDPVALNTEWTPGRNDGASFCTHRLVRVNPQKMEFRMTASTKALFYVFLVAGIIMLLYVFSGHWSAFPLCLGLGFTLVGGGLLYFKAAPLVFDKSAGMFLKGRTKAGQVPDHDNPKNMVALDSVHALQLLSKYVPAKKPYYTHELNLVLKNGKRLTVISHADKSRIREDAQTLSGFLNTPVWDAIDDDTATYSW